MTCTKIAAACIVLSCSISICLAQGMDMMGLGMMMGGGGLMGGMGGMGPADYAMLDSAVKYVVGPHASPDPQIIAFAGTQGGPPRTMMQMMPYIQLFQALGERVGVADLPKRPPMPTTGNFTMAQVAELMKPLPSARDVMMQRAMEWFNQNQLAAAAGSMMF